ncbi:MAG: 3-dehydroquinate synthase [Actinomycetes bacterium]|jgi:3-dehydroquinate synthase|nr:3-dehydroquinate synthase [Actinomycetes bacterium]
MAICCRRDFADGTRLDLDLGVARYPVFIAAQPARLLAGYLNSCMEVPPAAPGQVVLPAADDTEGFQAAVAPRVVVICDEHTAELFGVAVETAFITAGWQVDALTIPAGEATKTWEVAGQLLEALAELTADRNVTVCSLGGGVVSDIAGFIAACWMRGVDFVQIPTTLLALVDAAVGGKTAVNLSGGKNLAGAFKQPRAIASDVAFLAELPDAEYASGLAEAAKNALLAAGDLLEWTESQAHKLVARDRDALHELIVRNLEFKAGVVAADPADVGARAALNYGHTLGHALEQVAGYGVLSHGQAVAEGMRFAARLSVQLLGARADFVRRQDALLDALGIARVDAAAYSVAQLHDACYADKKARGGHLHMVLVPTPGDAQLVEVPDAVLYEHLNAWKLNNGHSGGTA